MWDPHSLCLPPEKCHSSGKAVWGSQIPGSNLATVPTTPLWPASVGTLKALSPSHFLLPTCNQHMCLPLPFSWERTPSAGAPGTCYQSNRPIRLPLASSIQWRLKLTWPKSILSVLILKYSKCIISLTELSSFQTVQVHHPCTNTFLTVMNLRIGHHGLIHTSLFNNRVISCKALVPIPDSWNSGPKTHPGDLQTSSTRESDVHRN